MYLNENATYNYEYMNKYELTFQKPLLFLSAE